MAQTGGAVRRNTIQRELVLTAVRELGSHPNADEVYCEVSRRHSGVSRSTVYRNLGILCDSGELLRITGAGGAEHFDHNTYSHVHFVCKRCGRCFDIKTMPMPNLISRVTDRRFEIDRCITVFSGLCGDCRDNSAKTPTASL